MIGKSCTGIFALNYSLIQKLKHENNITKVNNGFDFTDCIRNVSKSPDFTDAGLPKLFFCTNRDLSGNKLP